MVERNPNLCRLWYQSEMSTLVSCILSRDLICSYSLFPALSFGVCEQPMLDILCQNEKQHAFGHGDIRACPNPLSFIMSPATLPNQPSLVGIDLGEMRCLSSSALQFCSILDCIFESVSSTAILQQSGCLKTLQTKIWGLPKQAKTILYNGINRRQSPQLHLRIAIPRCV